MPNLPTALNMAALFGASGGRNNAWTRINGMHARSRPYPVIDHPGIPAPGADGQVLR